ncbi:MAG: hypothetical protein M9963_04540 [Kiritimatiellae bacterium]|nr:hypothetical protein [Kiritimatiellia bacterium]
MRYVVTLGIGAVLIAGSASAQIDFSARLVNSDVLTCESVPVVVTLQNNRVDALEASSEQGYSVAFEVTDPSGLLIRPMEKASVSMPATIPGQSTVSFTNDLQQIFPLGRYHSLSVRARLTVGSRSFVTDKMFVELLPGTEVMRLQAPAPDGQIHTYSLRTINREKRDRLFLRISNEDESLCYAVGDLGRYMRLGKPTLEADGLGRVHVLHMTAPNQFMHSVYEASGPLVSQTLVQGEVSMVRLVEDGAGSFRVAGGGVVSGPRDPMPEPLPVRRGL